MPGSVRGAAAGRREPGRLTEHRTRCLVHEAVREGGVLRQKRYRVRRRSDLADATVTHAAGMTWMMRECRGVALEVVCECSWSCGQISCWTD